jgi:hypothetical protein
MLFTLVRRTNPAWQTLRFQRMNKAAGLDGLTNAFPARRRSSSEPGRDAGIARVELRPDRANGGDDTNGNAGGKCELSDACAQRAGRPLKVGKSNEKKAAGKAAFFSIISTDSKRW